MAAPSTPTNFYVQQGNAQVYLNWDIIAGATSYPIQRSTDGVNFTSLSTPSTNSYLDTAVVVGTNYYYQVASMNASGTSPYTSAQSIVPTYSAQMTLGQIRLMAQQRADRVNSQFVTFTEWNTYINQSYFELYDLLITVYEDYYVQPPFTYVTDGITNQYTLPNGVLTDAITHQVGRPFYKLMGVDLGLDANSNAWVTLKKFNFISRNRYVYPQLTTTFLGVFNLRYRLVGNTIYFIPTPSANQFIRMWYVPKLNQLLQDTDILDGISGWTEYVIVDAAIKALQKEESDVSVLAAQKMMLIKRIEESSMNRDAGQPDTISDTRSFSERWGTYGPPNGDGSYGGF
jgi:fibronectin type 3 domain-containing protein